MIKTFAPIFAALVLVPSLAGAQQQQVPDPRTSAVLIQALQAQLRLGAAMLQVQQEDAEAREATLIEWLKTAQKNEK